MMKILQLEHVDKTYPSVAGVQPMILHDLNFEAEKGECMSIIGPSGSGKSTLLNLMGGLDKPTSGRVLLDGRDFAVLSEPELARVRNREIGFVFQLHHLLPQLTVLENVLLPTLAFKSETDDEGRAVSLLKRVGLEKHQHHHPAQLSGGEQQRVAVVRALINQPKLLLADEPTGSLDAASSEKLGDLLVELNRTEGVTLIIVTHSPALAKKTGRVYELSSSGLTAAR
jgi:lipoprotein-releasing system ATP-binding protein